MSYIKNAAQKIWAAFFLFIDVYYYFTVTWEFFSEARVSPSKP